MSSKWKRKMMTVVVMAAMVMCTACGNSAETTTEVGTTEITTEAVPEAASVAENTTEEIVKTQEARTFVDQAGNTIVVPEKIEKVIITSRTPLPSVYCLYRGSAEGLIGMSPGAMSAAELASTQEVSIEQIYEWNPEIILITNFTTLLPEDLLSNVLEGADWSHVTAVQKGNVYKFPLGMYRWCPPSSDAALSLQWVATKLQPELFADIDLNQEIKSYYKRFYGADLSDEDLQEIYNPSRDAADY